MELTSIKVKKDSLNILRDIIHKENITREDGRTYDILIERFSKLYTILKKKHPKLNLDQITQELKSG